MVEFSIVVLILFFQMGVLCILIFWLLDLGRQNVQIKKDLNEKVSSTFSNHLVDEE